jgi:hypothetical protein
VKAMMNKNSYHITRARVLVLFSKSCQCRSVGEFQMQ